MLALSNRFYATDLWLICLVVLASLMLSSEILFRVGRQAVIKGKVSRETIALKSTLLSSLQTLLALLIALTVSMSDLRYESRRLTLANETNAIGTSYRRSALIDEPEREKLRNLLREYVDNRLEFYKAPFDLPKLGVIHERALSIQREFWSIASGVARKDPDPVRVGPLLTSLNDIIMLQEKPTSTFENHVPDSIILLLVFGSMLMMGYLGFAQGLGGVEKPSGRIVLAVMITMTIIVILELDRPKVGTIKPGYESFVRLRSTMQYP